MESRHLVRKNQQPLVEKFVSGRSVLISDKSAFFRARAAHCRELAKLSLDGEIKRTLQQLAEEFDDAAISAARTEKPTD